MDRPFPAYGGEDAYVFVCYAHDDADRVYPDLAWLHQRGINIWYDEGITPGEEWNEELGKAIEGAERVVFFVTSASVASRHCRNEIQFAIGRDKDILALHLEPTELPVGLELSLGGRQAILSGELSRDGYRQKLMSQLGPGVPAASVPVTRSRGTRRRWLPIAAASLIVAAGAFLWRYAELLPTAPSPDETVQEDMRIGVLPFENLGAMQDEFFAAGMSDEINVRLGSVSGLQVVSRKSALRYAGSEKSSREIGAELGVGYLLYGRVRWAPRLDGSTRVRITPELIRVRDDTQIWSSTYDRVIDDIFDVQSDIAEQVIAQLGVTLLEGEIDRLTARQTDNPDAYALYLRGRYFWNRRTEENVQNALESFQQAVELDPGYALAHVGIGDVWIFRGWYSVRPPLEAFPRAKDAIDRALAYNGSLAEAHASRAHIYLEFDHDWPAAERGYRRALELNPEYPVAHHWYGGFLSAMGRHEEALEQAETARRLDPLSLIINTWVGLRHYFAGRYEDAIDEYRNALELDPDFAPAHWHLAWALQQAGRRELAIAAAERALAISDNPLYLASLGQAHAMAGNVEDARRILEQLAEESRDRHVSAYHTAVIHAALGDVDTSFVLLDRAFAERSPWIGYLNVDPRVEPLRSDPRFEGLLRRARLDA